MSNAVWLGKGYPVLNTDRSCCLMASRRQLAGPRRNAPGQGARALVSKAKRSPGKDWSKMT
jgi:hypothetical protein